MKINLYLLVSIFMLLWLAHPVSAQKKDSAAAAQKVANEPPSPIGGQNGMYRFIAQNIKYPPEAMDANIQGTVYVSLIVKADGSLDSITIKKDIGGGCGKEAVRVLTLMPKWKPAKVNGKPVDEKLVVPVRFSLR